MLTLARIGGVITGWFGTDVASFSMRNYLLRLGDLYVRLPSGSAGRRKVGSGNHSITDTIEVGVGQEPASRFAY